MLRKCGQALSFRPSRHLLLGARATPINCMGRRKNAGIDDTQFIGRANRGGNADDLLEGEAADDFASFVSARRQHLDRRQSGSNSGRHPNLNHLHHSSSSSAGPSASHARGEPSSVAVPAAASLRGKGKRIIVNAGGEKFETFEGTLLQYPQTPFGEAVLEQITSFGDGTIEGYQNAKTTPEVFFDADPRVFSFIMQFLRSGRIVLPTDDEPLRFAINGALKDFGLLDIAFPPLRAAETDAGDSDEPVPLVRLPDVCVIQMCDHLQHDQGVKRHAINISYGSDGFAVRDLCKKIRKDLNGQLSNTYWQCYQTHERSMFLITTKIANGTADLMMASVTQRLVEHTEQAMGYRLVSSYVTLSPDIKNTNVRLFIHNLIFRRVRNPSIEDTDAIQLFSNPDGSLSAAMGVVAGMQHENSKRIRDDESFVPNEEMFKNFEPPSLGPQDSYGKLGMPLTAPEGQRVPGNIWDE